VFRDLGMERLVDGEDGGLDPRTIFRHVFSLSPTREGAGLLNIASVFLAVFF